MSREDAITRMRSPLRELRFGKLRAVIALSIPYDVFELETKERLAIDAVKGTLDLYRIDSVPVGFEESRVVERELSPAQTSLALKRKLRKEQIADHHVETILVPYWVGIFERGGAVHIEVLDAIRGTLEGGKMRDLVEEYLTRRREGAKEETG